ncbi:hypothetical protein WJ23_02340 [Burkholderia lata]|uniref:hypothetical protein n=1 Tax=Burkholderia lata (strain ATCC 17760 / DSM 23089 / LMG 22485 / NCIMB 9086 / R18194 / 383) TaxID=482957 RepID=UPI000841434B|nr:hypothetical protein [Burkholderia lata]AOJ36813.1 hypothetical protein WJ23_02340 [Burkholderia lata]
MKPISMRSSGDTGKGDRTRIDDHPLAAKIGLVIGIIPIIIYWHAFNGFWSSRLPWVIALVLEIGCPLFLYVHYFLNRRSRRLIWEGVAVCVGFIPTWMLLGSYWLFYFCFAPMSVAIRAIALLMCLLVVATWAWLSWAAFARENARLGLLQKLFKDEGDCVVYPDESDSVIGKLDGPGKSIAVPYWLVSMVGPILIGYSMLSARLFEGNGGPHGMFIILSAIGLPITCWLLTKFFVRFAYFHIYLAIKLERKTGKKVVLGS